MSNVRVTYQLNMSFRDRDLLLSALNISMAHVQQEIDTLSECRPTPIIEQAIESSTDDLARISSFYQIIRDSGEYIVMGDDELPFPDVQ